MSKENAKNKKAAAADTTTVAEPVAPLEHPTEGGVYAREHPTAPLARNADGTLFRHDVASSEEAAASDATVNTAAEGSAAPVRNLD